MGLESVTDSSIATLLKLPKTITNPNARMVRKGAHWQRNYQVRSENGHALTLYVRQNVRHAEDFSCGLSWHLPSGETLTLVRYNGSSHSHRNQLEGTRVVFACHIHRATEKYIRANLKPEGYAEETAQYTTVNGALRQLVADCRISGCPIAPEDQPELFS